MDNLVNWESMSIDDLVNWEQVTVYSYRYKISDDKYYEMHIKTNPYEYFTRQPAFAMLIEKRVNSKGESYYAGEEVCRGTVRDCLNHLSKLEEDN